MNTYTITADQRLEAMDALYLPSMKTEAMLRQKDKAYVMLQSLTPNSGEPTAWLAADEFGSVGCATKESHALRCCEAGTIAEPLYLHPAPVAPAKPAQPLTDEQIQEIFSRAYKKGYHGRDFENAFARAIEAHIKGEQA